MSRFRPSILLELVLQNQLVKSNRSSSSGLTDASSLRFSESPVEPGECRLREGDWGEFCCMPREGAITPPSKAASTASCSSMSCWSPLMYSMALCSVSTLLNFLAFPLEVFTELLGRCSRSRTKVLLMSFTLFLSRSFLLRTVPGWGPWSPMEPTNSRRLLHLRISSCSCLNFLAGLRGGVPE